MRLGCAPPFRRGGPPVSPEKTTAARGATGIVEIHDIRPGVWISTTRRLPERAYGRGVTEPPIPAGRRDPAAAVHLQTLTAWRRGARLAIALASAVAAVGLLRPGACAVTLGAALLLAAAIEIAARDALRACVMCAELSALPAVARERARLTGAAHRGRLAAELRGTARHRPRSAREQRVSPYPPERLAAARAGLFELADAVEAAPDPDPAVVAEIETLLRDGARSPLLNAHIPAAELPVAMRRARYRLATDTPQPATPTAAVARRGHGRTRPRPHRNAHPTTPDETPR